MFVRACNVLFFWSTFGNNDMANCFFFMPGTFELSYQNISVISVVPVDLLQLGADLTVLPWSQKRQMQFFFSAVTQVRFKIIAEVFECFRLFVCAY